jgi:hypothetical protein
MGAPSKRAKRIRRADEFDLQRIEQLLRLPRDGRNTIDAWALTDIRDARTQQMLGQFVQPARMAEQMRTDDALAVAYENRLAPQRCIPVHIEAAQGARGEAIAAEAEALYGANGIAIHPEVLADVHGCLVNHGVAFATIVATPREDGSRIDLELKYWPIEYVRWDPVFRVFKARADPNSVQPGDIPENPPGVLNEYGFVGGFWIPVVHGDGRWIIFKKHEIEPFRQEAALLPAALVWARHAFAARDWSKGSVAHGSAKVIGELPAGVPLQSGNGTLTAEAQAMIDLLRSIASSDSPVGIRPAGSKTDFMTNTSTAWQVWSELVQNAEKSAARIYLGTDGTLGSAGGAPGVNIEALFGVAATKVRGDLEAIDRALDTGLIQPWCAINFGDSRLAPKRKYIVPNDDKQAVTEDFAKRNAAYYEALKAAKESGMDLNPVYVAELAKKYDVPVPLYTPTPSPTKAASATVQSTIKKEGSKWVVYSEDDSKKLGTYDTKAEAEKRLKQIEYYK